MQLVALFAVLAAAAVPGDLATVELFCDCRVSHHQDWTYALHCSSEQNGTSGVSCHKAEVPEIPRGYNYIPGYGLIRLYRTFKPWEAAKKFCEDEGAQLAVPPDRYAYDGLKQIFPKEKGIWYAFLGITDQVSEGVFVGVNGRPVAHLPWQPKEPNNGNGGKEDCVDVRNDGLLNDVPCERPAPFFCERRLSVGVPDTYTWLEDAGRFYKVHAEKKVHAEAARVCRSENATLAVTDTWRRGEALLRLFEPKYDSYLIGFMDEAVEGNFVTETAELSDIPRGYNYIPGYGLIRLYRTFKPWAAAKKFCEDEGSHLAIPPDRYAYDGLKQIFPKEKGIWYAFIGVTDQVSEGVFVGVDGRPVPYLPWQPNEPDNGKGSKEDCVDVRNDGLLNDAPCWRPEPFFCERGLTVGIPDTYAWLEDAGRFYKVHTEKKVYAEAVRVCRSENATLAVTDTWRRGEALLRLFDPKDDGYLIGFTDEAVEGDFVTETGRHLKDMEFQIWGANEPNNDDSGKPENCMALVSKGFYNDVRCDKELPFICEIVPI